jgi:hypothetical protein
MAGHGVRRPQHLQDLRIGIGAGEAGELGVMRLTDGSGIDEAEHAGHQNVGRRHEACALGGIRGRRDGRDAAGGAGDEGAAGEGAKTGEVGKGKSGCAGIDDDGAALLAGVRRRRVGKIGKRAGTAAAPAAARGIKAVRSAVGAEAKSGSRWHRDGLGAADDIEGEKAISVDDDEDALGLRHGEARRRRQRRRRLEGDGLAELRGRQRHRPAREIHRQRVRQGKIKRV